MRGSGLDLDHPADRVLNLMQIVGVPTGDQSTRLGTPLVEVTAGAGAATMA